jgi:hypothetical protein
MYGIDIALNDGSLYVFKSNIICNLKPYLRTNLPNNSSAYDSSWKNFLKTNCYIATTLDMRFNFLHATVQQHL